MEYYLEAQNANNPTLEEMTRKAIEMLQKESNGYVLLVEGLWRDTVQYFDTRLSRQPKIIFNKEWTLDLTGGRIDQAHHDGRAKLALEESYQFDLAISAALNMTNPLETLIIVTADHSHTMIINGYPDRGNDILGV